MSNLKDNLDGLTWQQATKQVHSFNSIAALVYHVNYFVLAALTVLRGEPLTAHDKFSFDVPSITTPQEWEMLMNKTFADAEQFAQMVENLPEEKLWENFANEKYGSYYRNIQGIIEHYHYHLGQIALIRKLVIEEGVS